MNPPFSDTSVWVKHLSIYIATGAVDQAIVLVPQGSVTNKGFSLFMNQASAMVLLTPRLNFLDLNYEPIGEFSSFNVALVYYGEHTPDSWIRLMRLGLGVCSTNPTLSVSRSSANTAAVLSKRKEAPPSFAAPLAAYQHIETVSQN